MEHLIASFGLTHLIYGGIFGWAAAIGAIFPDLPGINGWWHYFVDDEDPGDWFWAMDDWAWDLYDWLHAMLIPAAIMLVCFGLHVAGVVPGGLFNPIMGFCWGWFMHCVMDFATHRGSRASYIWPSMVGLYGGRNWYDQRFWWWEWATIGSIVAGWYWLGLNNVVIDWIVGLFS